MFLNMYYTLVEHSILQDKQEALVLNFAVITQLISVSVLSVIMQIIHDTAQKILFSYIPLS